MKALLIDTSGSQSYLALSENGLVIAQTMISDSRQLSKFLLPSIAELLQGRTLDYISIGVGPGSFTGTRIGAAVAKTLAYAKGIPLVVFSSTFLPDLAKIARFCFEKFQKTEFSSQIELVYFSPSP